MTSTHSTAGPHGEPEVGAGSPEAAAASARSRIVAGEAGAARDRPIDGRRRSRPLVAAVVLATALAGCSVGETYHHGQRITPEQLQQVPVGSSREQVLLALGSPSTAGVAGGDVLYYLSQTSRRPVAFMNASVVDRRILAIYLDEDQRVREIAEYGIKDGKVFDYLARRTPTGGADLVFIGQILSGVVAPGL